MDTLNEVTLNEVYFKKATNRVKKGPLEGVSLYQGFRVVLL